MEKKNGQHKVYAKITLNHLDEKKKKRKKNHTLYWTDLLKLKCVQMCRKNKKLKKTLNPNLDIDIF